MASAIVRAQPLRTVGDPNNDGPGGKPYATHNLYEWLAAVDAEDPLEAVATPASFGPLESCRESLDHDLSPGRDLPFRAWSRTRIYTTSSYAGDHALVASPRHPEPWTEGA